jgi:hypothetical protein
MNKRSLGALIALNLVLLLGLIVVTLSPQPAYGQLKRAEYLMISGSLTRQSQFEAIFIIELSTQRMLAFFYSGGDDRIDLIDRRELTADLELAQGGK